MNKYDDIKVEIQELINEGNILMESLSNYYVDENSVDVTKPYVLKDYFFKNYESWYTKAHSAVKQILPDRIDDFSILYRNNRRSTLTAETYTSSDALLLLGDSFSFAPNNAVSHLGRQVGMLIACLERFDSKIYDLHTLIEADVFDSEIESAKHLHKLGYLRAAGAICGVIIEKHFKGVADAHNIAIKKKNPTIADYNDKFKDVVYDTIEWRRIQRLGDLRNLCDHNKDRDPTADEVTELISGTERTIKTIF